MNDSTTRAITPKTPVDWSSVRARLERTTRAFGSGELAPEAAAAVLARRAAALAVPRPTTEEPSGGTLEVVAFELNSQVFAVEARQVRETLLPRDLTRLPGLPEHVRGIVNVRSRVVAALDLRPLLQLRGSDEASGEKLLIVEHDGAEFGLLAERVLGMKTVNAVLRREVPGLNEKYLRGLTDDGTAVLAIDALFPDLVVDDAPDT